MNKLGLILILIASTVAHAAAEDRWPLATADTRLVLRVDANQLSIENLESAVGQQKWLVGKAKIPLLSRVWIADRELQIGWIFAGAESNPDLGTLTLTFNHAGNNAGPKLSLRSIWRARPGRGPIEHSIEIDNRSSLRVTVPQQESLQLSSLALADPKSTHIWWIKRGGSNASTQGGVFVEPIAPNHELVLASNPEDGASPVPWLAVQNQHGGLYVGWEFSGLGRIRAQTGPSIDALDIQVGNHPDFKTDIEPGETFHVPPAFVGCYAGDIDEGSYSLHRFIIEKLRPRVPKDYPDPTLAYNLYLDVGGNKATERDVLRSVATCQDLGFETFMPDAMWFPETGDWRWDPARFPHGIGPIERAVHAGGMKLALWCAWTNGGVSSDPEALSIRGPVAHPDWFRSDVPADWMPAAFSGAQVCLGSEPAKAWEIEKTQWLVEHHKLDYLKHDISPIVNTCARTTHRHHHGTDASYWATMGYYAVQEKLLAANPQLMLENCSGGGQIKDFGIIQRTHYTVATDTLSNLPDRQAIYDSTFAFPPLVLQAYTYDNYFPVKGDQPGPFLWRSGMMSAWQIDPTDTPTWTDGERDATRRAAEIYKQWIRPMLQDAKVHHILPRPDGVNWDGMFYFSAPLKRGMLYAFRPDAPEDRKTIRLKGLDADASYWIWGEDASVTPAQQSGEALMTKGVTPSLPNRYSCDLVYLQDASLGKPQGLEMPGEFTLGNVETSAGWFAASATLSWRASVSANRYRVMLSDFSDFHELRYETTVSGNSTIIPTLPAERLLFWKVEAIAWGGRRASSGEAGQFTTQKLRKLPGVTFASDLPWVKATAGADNSVHRDTNLQGKPISVAQSECEKGVWTHAFNDATPADVVIDLGAYHFTKFVARCGVEDSAGGGSVQFQVLVDGQMKDQSEVLRAGVVHLINVDVAGAKQITLRLLNGGDGYACDHAAWGWARFLDNAQSDPLDELIKGAKR